MKLELDRAISVADIDIWTAAIARTFHFTGSLDDLIALNRQIHDEGARSTIATADGILAGTFRSFDTRLTMPGGGELDVDAITGITVQSTHRRRGVLTEMMRAELPEAVERGQAAAILWSAEFPIYGRFGFGVATRAANLTIDVRRATLRDTPSDGACRGNIRYVTVDELCALAPAPFHRVRSQRIGELARDELKWRIESNVTPWPDHPWNGWQVVSSDAHGDVDGVAKYHVDSVWAHGVPNSTLYVDAIVASTPEAHERLWRFLLNIDLIATIKANDIALDDPLPWMLEDGRALVAEIMADGLWLRPLDPVAMLSQRSLGDGSVTLEIVDPTGFANGVVRVEAGAVQRVHGSSADLTVDTRTFATMFLGTESPRVLAAAHVVDEHRSGSIDKLDALLRTGTTPHCSTHF